MKRGHFCAQPRALARAGCSAGCAFGCVLACARGPPVALQSNMRQRGSTRVNAHHTSQLTCHSTSTQGETLMTTQNSNRPANRPTTPPTNPLIAAQSQLRSYLHKRLHALATEENGMSTVEYALGTIAAAAFGALLYTVVTGGDITQALTDIIERALNTDV